MASIPSSVVRITKLLSMPSNISTSLKHTDMCQYIVLHMPLELFLITIMYYKVGTVLKQVYQIEIFY